MISCITMGGLGNQLFQIYTTMALSIEMKTPFNFPNNKLESDKRSDTYWDSFLKELSKNMCLVDIKNLKYPVYKEKEFKYNKIQIVPEVIRKHGGMILYGYFQSYKYFDKQYEQISRYIRLDESKQAVRNKYYKKYENNNTISIHFRMGDYKALQNCHPILRDEYYINSIKFILNKTQKNSKEKNSKEKNSKEQGNIKWTILYFCEDEDIDEVVNKIEKIKTECCESCESCELEFERGGEPTMEDWQQLLLMSCCQHNIIANSSFSWWAAYFNNSRDKIICYPEKWFGSQLAHHDTRDLCPTNWNKIRDV